MAEPGGDFTELFTRARAADILAVVGHPLWRAGRRMRGPCPICGASQGKRADGAFSVDAEAGLFTCWACGAKGDVIALEQAVGGGSAVDAAKRLAGEGVMVRPRPAAVARPAIPAGPTSAERIAAAIWGGCDARPLCETPGAAYLKARAISAATIAAASESFGGRGWRYHPEAAWAWDEVAGRWLAGPALVARLVAPDAAGRPRPTGGVHVTYLAADHTRKIRRTPAKRMWGPQKDAEGRPGGVILIGRASGPQGPMLVAEGIESALSAADLTGGWRTCVATLSLGALQGGWKRDNWGRVDPAAPAADPETRAFTWPGVHAVTIAVDRDMKPVRVKARKPGGGTCEVVLDAEARARICAGLASAAWRAAGATDVRVIAPAAGRDFNDELVARWEAGL